MIASTHPFVSLLTIQRSVPASGRVAPDDARHTGDAHGESEGERGRDHAHTTRGQARTKDAKPERDPRLTRKTSGETQQASTPCRTALQHQNYHRPVTRGDE